MALAQIVDACVESSSQWRLHNFLSNSKAKMRIEVEWIMITVAAVFSLFECVRSKAATLLIQIIYSYFAPIKSNSCNGTI